jgi:hypothetical protein
MFLENSRYARQPTADVTTPDGRTVTALTLRPLPAVTGAPHPVVDHDRLDLLAFDTYSDGTRFWHVADANTALDASRELVARTGDTLNLPAT